MKTYRTVFLWLAVIFCLPTTLFAWGTKEHVQLTRLAVMRILDDPTAPQPLKNWLKTITPDLTTIDGEKQFFYTAKLGAVPKDLIGLSYWAIKPDLNANGDKKTLIQPFGLPERLLHFIDLEYINREPDQRVYKHDLSSLPDAAAVPKDFKDPRYKEAGILPFAVERSYTMLVEAIKAGKLAAGPDAGDDDHAVRWAGYLAHYVQDNTQPHHSTADYKSVSYFADKRSAPNVHSEVEWKMNDDEKQPLPQLRADYWAALTAALAGMKDPAVSQDPFMSTIEISRYSYTKLPLIGLAAMAASGQAGTPEKPVGRAGPMDTEKFFRFESDVTGTKQSMLQMKADQQAIAVLRTQSLITRAWIEATK